MDSRRSPVIEVGRLRIEIAQRRVSLRDEEVHVSQKEFELLRTLATEPTRVFTKDELLRAIWGFRSSGSTRTLDSHACRLRRKLVTEGERYVVSVWGVGYRLIDGPRRGERPWPARSGLVSSVDEMSTNQAMIAAQPTRAAEGLRHDVRVARSCDQGPTCRRAHP